MDEAGINRPLLVLLIAALLTVALLLTAIHVAANPGWQIVTLDSAANHRAGACSSIKLDSSGRPHISYTYTNTSLWEGGLRYASYNGTAWNIQTVVPNAGNRIYSTSLALDSLDRPHISFFNNADASFKYASYNGTAWQVQVIESGMGTGTSDMISSIATDSADKPHVSFRHGTWSIIRYASCNGTTWSAENVTGNCGGSNSLALDDFDVPHISYNYGTGGAYLGYATDNGTHWNTVVVDNSNFYTGRDTSIAVDSNNYPHISHRDDTNGRLKYSYKDGTGWHNQVVDADGDVGKFTSLALDGDNHPHISYVDDTNNRLKYASYNGTAWNTTAVDTMNTPWFTSLALDGDSHAHISYFYLTSSNTGDLKYATFVPAPGLSVSKGGPASALVGENITYWVAVSNTGDLPLQKISVSDNRSGVVTSISGLFSATLPAGACENRTYTYKVLAGDLPGPIVNKVTAVYGCTGFDDLSASDNHSVSLPGVYGRVGVGVDPPVKILHVKGSGFGSIPLFQRGTDSAGFIIERTTTNRWLFGVNESPTLGYGFVISTIPQGTTSVPRLVIAPSGNVTIPGSISAGAKNFRIDHPLDPADRYLLHSFVESPDMLNLYSGNVVLDEKGEAVVELPSYFSALNRDYTYQLDTVGGFAPVYVSQEIGGNKFRIAGGKPGLKVYWEVTGTRADPYAVSHPVVVEQGKPVGEKGFYMHPLECEQPRQ